MNPKFFRALSRACFFVFLMQAGSFPLFASAEKSDPDDPPSSETLDSIAAQFRGLSGSLSQMPAPPKLDETIQLPMRDLPEDGLPSADQRNDTKEK